MSYIKNIFPMLFSVWLFSACKSRENIITTDLSIDSYGFYYATLQDSIYFQTLLDKTQKEDLAFIKKAREEEKEGKISGFFLEPYFQEAQYPGGMAEMKKKILENLNLPKNAKKGITKIRIIIDKAGYAKPEILQYNDERVKNALIESVNNMPKWIPGKIIEGCSYKVDLSLEIPPLLNQHN